MLRKCLMDVVENKEKNLRIDPQAFRNSSPGLYLECNLRRDSHARTSQLSCSLISDPQKLYEIINADCHFKPFNLGVICYTDNKYGSEKNFFSRIAKDEESALRQHLGPAQ